MGSNAGSHRYCLIIGVSTLHLDIYGAFECVHHLGRRRMLVTTFGTFTFEHFKQLEFVVGEVFVYEEICRICIGGFPHFAADREDECF